MKTPSVLEGGIGVSVVREGWWLKSYLGLGRSVSGLVSWRSWLHGLGLSLFQFRASACQVQDGLMGLDLDCCFRESG